MHSFLALDFYSPSSALAGSLACLLLGCLLFCCWPSVVFEKVMTPVAAKGSSSLTSYS